MKYATIWKQARGRGGYVAEWRDTFDLSQQQEPTLSQWYATKPEAKRAVKISGAKLWN